LSRISTSKASASALGGGFGILSENPPDFDWGTPQALQAPQAPEEGLFALQSPSNNLSNEELSSIMAGQMPGFQNPFAGGGSFSVNPDRDLIGVL
nr:hypothetical protein [Candidatus Omnitrophota bacterium]